MDIGHERTDLILEDLEKRIKKEYRQASREVQKKLDTYLERFKERDKLQRTMLRANKITRDEYTNWRKGQILVRSRWEEMRDTLALVYHNANDVAKGMVNGTMPDVYALNYNYGTYEVEHGLKIDTSFTLYNREAVENILRKNPDLLPPPGKEVSKRIAAGLDVRWNRQQIQSVMMQGILQGESIPKLAKRLATTVGSKNMVAAIRNARTMTTRAQNLGRLNSYERASEMGIMLKKQWVATLDHRTRDSHVDVDGEIVGINEVFSNGLDCPGGMGPPEEVYNCRCTMISINEGFDPDKMNEYIESRLEYGDMNYDEWEEDHAE